MDLFFLGWNFVDTVLFTMILIAVIWYLVDRRMGIRLFYILIINAVVNDFLKNTFMLPRPCQIDPSVGLLCPLSYGFPSGAAQKALLLAGIVFIEYRIPLYRILGIIFALFLCFSRIYLGVHYFTDVLGGLFVGAVLLLLYWKLFPLMERKEKIAIFLVLAVLFVMGYFSSPLFWISLGVGMGLFLAEKKKQEVQGIHFRLFITLFVLIGLAAFYWGMFIFPRGRILSSFMGGLWLSYLGSLIAEKFKDRLLH